LAEPIGSPGGVGLLAAGSATGVTILNEHGRTLDEWPAATLMATDPGQRRLLVRLGDEIVHAEVAPNGQRESTWWVDAPRVRLAELRGDSMYTVGGGEIVRWQIGPGGPVAAQSARVGVLSYVVALSSTLLALATTSGIEVIDVSPEEFGSRVDFFAGGLPTGMTWLGRRLVVVEESGTVSTFELGSGTSRPVHTLDLDGRLAGVGTGSGLVWIAAELGGVVVVDVRGPEAIEVARLPVPGEAVAAVGFGSGAAIAARNGGVRIFAPLVLDPTARRVYLPMALSG
jgi:hypothetical protein